MGVDANQLMILAHLELDANPLSMDDSQHGTLCPIGQ